MGLSFCKLLKKLNEMEWFFIWVFPFRENAVVPISFLSILSSLSLSNKTFICSLLYSCRKVHEINLWIVLFLQNSDALLMSNNFASIKLWLIDQPIHLCLQFGLDTYLHSCSHMERSLWLFVCFSLCRFENYWMIENYNVCD